MSGIELSLENELHLKVLEQKIANLTIEDLRILFMELARQKSIQENACKLFLQQATASAKDCYCQLNKVEKEYEAYRREISRSDG